MLILILFTHFITSQQYWREDFIQCHNHHNGTLRPLQRNATDVQYHKIPRVGHGHPESRMIQLPMTLHINPGKLGVLISSVVLLSLQFI